MLLSRAQLELVFWKWCNLQAHFTNHKESTSSLPSASPPPSPGEQQFLPHTLWS